LDANVDAILQQGLAQHRWDAVIEQLRKAGDESGDDPAAIALDRVRAEVGELIDSLSKASSVREVRKVGKRLNERIDIMKGLESAITERAIAGTGAG
jgi:hypothetical protein